MKVKGNDLRTHIVFIVGQLRFGRDPLKMVPPIPLDRERHIRDIFKTKMAFERTGRIYWATQRGGMSLEELCPI